MDLAEPFRLRAQYAQRPSPTINANPGILQTIIEDQMKNRRVALAAAWKFRHDMDTAQNLSQQLGFPVIPGETPEGAIRRLDAQKEAEGKKGKMEALTKALSGGVTNLTPEEQANLGPLDLDRLTKREKTQEMDVLQKDLAPILGGKDPREVENDAALMGKLPLPMQDKVRRQAMNYRNYDLSSQRETRIEGQATDAADAKAVETEELGAIGGARSMKDLDAIRTTTKAGGAAWRSSYDLFRGIDRDNETKSRHAQEDRDRAEAKSKGDFKTYVALLNTQIDNLASDIRDNAVFDKNPMTGVTTRKVLSAGLDTALKNRKAALTKELEVAGQKAKEGVATPGSGNEIENLGKKMDAGTATPEEANRYLELTK